MTAILHAIAPGPVGGAETVVLGLVEGLRERGADVTIAVLADASSGPFITRARDAGIPVTVLESPGRDYLRDVRGLADTLAARGARVLHTHGYRADIVGLFAARRAGAAVVGTAHGFTHGGWKNRLNQRLQLAALRRHDAAIAVSAPLRDELARRGVARVELVRNAWRPSGALPSRAEARARLELPVNGPVVGWVGRFTWVKDAAHALAAFAASGRQDATLAFVGNGPDRAALEADVAARGLTGRVRLHGAVPDAWRVLPAFDALVLSSRSEGTPMVLLEAMHAGVPIVSTAVGGVPELLGDAALLAPPGDAPALGAALRATLDDPAAACARAGAARARLEAGYSWDEWLDRHLDLYRRLAARTR